VNKILQMMTADAARISIFFPIYTAFSSLLWTIISVSITTPTQIESVCNLFIWLGYHDG